MMLSAHIIYTIAALTMNGSVTLGRITDCFGFFALVPPVSALPTEAYPTRSSYLTIQQTPVPQPAEVPTGVLTMEQIQLQEGLQDYFRSHNKEAEDFKATIAARDSTIHDKNMDIRDYIDTVTAQDNTIRDQSDVIAEKDFVIIQQNGTIANQTDTIARQGQVLEGFNDAHDLRKTAWKKEQEAARGYEELVKMAEQA